MESHLTALFPSLVYLALTAKDQTTGKMKVFGAEKEYNMKLSAHSSNLTKWAPTHQLHIR